MLLLILQSGTHPFRLWVLVFSLLWCLPRVYERHSWRKEGLKVVCFSFLVEKVVCWQLSIVLSFDHRNWNNSEETPLYLI